MEKEMNRYKAVWQSRLKRDEHLKALKLKTGRLLWQKAVLSSLSMKWKKTLEMTNGNKTKGAQLLEISHRALLYKIKEYGL